MTNPLNEYDVRNKTVTYVKDEGWHLNIMTNIFKSIVKCEALGLKESYYEHVLGMFFPKLVNMPSMMRKFVNILNMFS
jgi:hypothetical protein